MHEYARGPAEEETSACGSRGLLAQSTRSDVLPCEINEISSCFLVRQGPARDDEALTPIEPQEDAIVVFRNVPEGSPGIFRRLGLIAAF